MMDIIIKTPQIPIYPIVFPHLLLLPQQPQIFPPHLATHWAYHCYVLLIHFLSHIHNTTCNNAHTNTLQLAIILPTPMTNHHPPSRIPHTYTYRNNKTLPRPKTHLSPPIWHLTPYPTTPLLPSSSSSSLSSPSLPSPDPPPLPRPIIRRVHAQQKGCSIVASLSGSCAVVTIGVGQVTIGTVPSTKSNLSYISPLLPPYARPSPPYHHPFHTHFILHLSHTCPIPSSSSVSPPTPTFHPSHPSFLPFLCSNLDQTSSTQIVIWGDGYEF